MGKTEKYDHMKLIRQFAGGYRNLITLGRLLATLSAALLCTYIAAFRVQANMRSSLMRRIITLPLGVFDEDGTGKIRRIVSDSTAATETYIAHTHADKTVAAITPVGLLVTDQILVVSDGEIIERGDHQALMDLNGPYAHMVSLQAS